MARELTEAEVRTAFLHHVWSLVHYWDREPNRRSCRGRLEGLAFSLLVALDGCADGLPAFIVAPCPHPDDKADQQEDDEN